MKYNVLLTRIYIYIKELDQNSDEPRAPLSDFEQSTKLVKDPAVRSKKVTYYRGDYYLNLL